MKYSQAKNCETLKAVTDCTKAFIHFYKTLSLCVFINSLMSDFLHSFGEAVCVVTANCFSLITS